MKIIQGLYQFAVALPILLVLTLFTAVTTILFSHWKNAWWLHHIQAFWSRCFCYLFFIPTNVTGVENIRHGESYVFVSNHQSMFDIFMIYGWLPVIFKWLMKKELRRIPFVGWACQCAGHIFVDRGHARAAQSSLVGIEKQLNNGICTVIFPEGTRSKDGQIGPFKRGAFQIAWDLKLKVIPLSLTGCYEVLPKGQFLISRHPIRMTIGTPIDLDRFNDPQEAIAAVREAVITGCRQ